MERVFSVSEIISFLEKKTYDAFTFRDGCAYIVSQEAGEIIIEASGSLIAEERRKYVIDMLNNLHRMAVQDALGAELPAEYADFLRTVNGVLFNGYTVCGIDRHLLSEAPVQPVTGLLENNQVWHENEWMKQFLFIGDSDISWYVFDAAHGKYCELDKPSGCCVTCFCSFADMLETILRNSLK